MNRVLKILSLSMLAALVGCKSPFVTSPTVPELKRIYGNAVVLTPPGMAMTNTLRDEISEEPLKYREIKTSISISEDLMTLNSAIESKFGGQRLTTLANLAKEDSRLWVVRQNGNVREHFPLFMIQLFELGNIAIRSNDVIWIEEITESGIIDASGKVAIDGLVETAGTYEIEPDSDTDYTSILDKVKLLATENNKPIANLVVVTREVEIESTTVVERYYLPVVDALEFKQIQAWNHLDPWKNFSLQNNDEVQVTKMNLLGNLIRPTQKSEVNPETLVGKAKLRTGTMAWPRIRLSRQ